MTSNTLDFQEYAFDPRLSRNRPVMPFTGPTRDLSFYRVLGPKLRGLSRLLVPPAVPDAVVDTATFLALVLQ